MALRENSVERLTYFSFSGPFCTAGALVVFGGRVTTAIKKFGSWLRLGYSVRVSGH